MVTDVEVARTAAAAGAAEIRHLYGARVERFMKSPTDFATTADLAAERAIRDVILELRPDDAFLGEETGLSGAIDGRVWLVDPLCGTLNFAATTPLFSVNVALRAPQGTVAAAVADPIAGEVYTTDGELVPDAASGLVDLDLDHADLTRLATAPAFRERFGPRVTSTTLALAWVAIGRRAAYLCDGDMRDNVHFAAGIALCRAAGCVVTAFDGGPIGEGPGVLAAADAETHAALLEMMSDLGSPS